ncbi:MAG: endo-1,4-beta-xylanase [bacterium]|nr:endo-1,4-beta-xylanase [bacterium]
MANRREEVLRPFVEQADYLNERVSTGIEMNRKGWAELSFVDREGKPVKGVTVEARQRTHDFKTGANLFMLEELETPEKNAEYKRLFADAFNLATLPFYWRDLEPEQGKPRFAKDSPKVYRRPAPDLCLEYCEKHGIEPKCHCLNYDQWSPDWLANEVPVIRQALVKRFTELSERYSKRIPSWEVTNETLFLNARTVNFHTPDLVEWSFHTADRLFPNNRLIINEAHCNIWDVFLGTRSAYYMQIQRALSQGCRIDTIGMQYHMFYREEDEAEKTAIFYSPEHMFKVLDQYADFQIPLQITELTIPAYHWTEEDEDIQAEILKNIYSMWFSHPAMSGIIYWNLVDGYAAFAPQGDMTSGENYYHGGLVRFDFTPKKSYYTLRDLFKKTWHTETTVTGSEDGRAHFKGFYGEYDLTIHAGEKTVTRRIHLTKKGAKSFRIEL